MQRSLIGNPVKVRSGPAAVIPIPEDDGISASVDNGHCPKKGREGRQRSGEPEDLPGSRRKNNALSWQEGGDEVNQGAIPGRYALGIFFVP